MKTARKHISIRLSSLERNALRIIADQEGVCPTEMMRILLREGTYRRGIQPLIFASSANEICNPEVQFEKS